MSTVSDNQEKVRRLRRRPAKTVTNARTSRVIFGKLVIKELISPHLLICIIITWMGWIMLINCGFIISHSGCITWVENHYNTFYWIPLLLIAIRYIIIYLSIHISLGITLVKENSGLDSLFSYLSGRRDSLARQHQSRPPYPYEFTPQ